MAKRAALCEAGLLQLTSPPFPFLGFPSLPSPSSFLGCAVAAAALESHHADQGKLFRGHLRPELQSHCTQQLATMIVPWLCST